MDDRFVLGVNYWPRRKAMYWWNSFDAWEVRDEFDLIAELGMDVVRIFLLWDDWQPTASSVDRSRLTDLGVVCDAAASRGLGLDVTFFTGHMSGPNWAPRWMLDPDGPHPSPHVRQVVSGGNVVHGSYRNMYTDPEAIAASRMLVRTVVGSYRDHDAVWMWNLGNEPDLFAHPPSAGAGRAWVRTMRELIGEIDDHTPVTCGLHTASLFEDNGFRVGDVFAETDVGVMHGYPMYVPWAKDPLDADFVPFLCELTSALSGKPTLAEEWGGCTVPGASETWEWESYGGAGRTQFMAGEHAFADYVGQVLPRLVTAGSTGAMLWCFADYAEELWDRPPCDPHGAKHERHFGLVRPDGTPKPHTDVIKAFAATGPRVQSLPHRLTIDPDTYYQDPHGNAQRAYLEYLQKA
jgi:endo-1,4-beta-mannosidase